MVWRRSNKQPKQKRSSTRDNKMLDLYDAFVAKNKADFIIGIDEVGWGAVAGPLVLGCAVFKPDYMNLKIKDSKSFTTERSREKALDQVKLYALYLDIEVVSVGTISMFGAGAAIQQGLHNLASRAVAQFPNNSCVVMDGSNTIRNFTHPQAAYPKADTFVTAVSAASILAKCHRDQLMTELSKEYPEYDWFANKGYPTDRHFQLIRTHGVSAYHRMNVQVIKQMHQKFGNYEDRGGTEK